VSSRDQYFLVQTRRKFDAKLNPNKKRVYYMAAKSKDLPEYGPSDNCVRATTILTGYYIIELEPGRCEVHFFIESDFKISMFIAK
jgi:hypothetical protein